MEVRDSRFPHHAVSVLEQLAKMERASHRRELAEAIAHGLLTAAFAIGVGSLCITFVALASI